MTAEHLLAVNGALKAQVGEEGLGHGGQQRYQLFAALARGGIFAVLGAVQLQGDIGGEGTPAFDQRLHGQQHATHIGVDDDRIGGLVLGLRAGRCQLCKRSRAYSTAFW